MFSADIFPKLNVAVPQTRDILNSFSHTESPQTSAIYRYTDIPVSESVKDLGLKIFNELVME